MELIRVTKTGITQTPLTPLFMNFCEELSAFTKTYGINLKPHSEIGIAKFSSLSVAQQTGIVEALRGYISQLNSAVSEGIEPRGADNRRHAWWSLSKLGLRPPIDLFNQITDSDIIEIYNKDSIQVFRSFDMFQYLSYSLSDIFSHDWVELYNRDEFVFNRMFGLVGDVLSGKITDIVHSNFPTHTVEEKFSENKCWAKMKHVLVSPLFTSDGGVGGLISTFKILDHGHS